MIDERICAKCPLGPKPHERPECKRCVADDMAVGGRHEMLERFRHLLNVDGVDVTACFEYDLLPRILAHGDPASEDSSRLAS